MIPLSFLLTVRYIHTHISQRAHPASHQILLSQPHSQAQVRDADVSLGEQIPKNPLNWFFAVMTHFPFFLNQFLCPSSPALPKQELSSKNKYKNHVTNRKKVFKPTICNYQGMQNIYLSKCAAKKERAGAEVR